MDLIALLATAAPTLTAHLPKSKADEVTLMLGGARTDFAHAMVHVAAIVADGRLTVLDVPDIVMFAIDLFTALAKISFKSFSADDILVLAQNAVTIIISSPVFGLTAGEIRSAVGVADTCFGLARRTVKSAGSCSSMWAAATSCCHCSARPYATAQAAVTVKPGGTPRPVSVSA
jgi:hypothetical protein